MFMPFELILDVCYPYMEAIILVLFILFVFCIANMFYYAMTDEFIFSKLFKKIFASIRKAKRNNDD